MELEKSSGSAKALSESMKRRDQVLEKEPTIIQSAIEVQEGGRIELREGKRERGVKGECRTILFL